MASSSSALVSSLCLRGLCALCSVHVSLNAVLCVCAPFLCLCAPFLCISGAFLCVCAAFCLFAPRLWAFAPTTSSVCLHHALGAVLPPSICFGCWLLGISPRSLSSPASGYFFLYAVELRGVCFGKSRGV